MSGATASFAQHTNRFLKATTIKNRCSRNTISAFDEGAAVDAAVKVLKQMLTECVRDIAHSANKRADQIVMSLSRLADELFSCGELLERNF